MELTAQFMILCLCLLSGIIVGDGKEKLREESSRKELIGGLFGGLFLGALIVLVFLRVKKCIKRRCIKESHQGEPEESVKLQNNNQSGEIGVQFDPCESFSLMESHQRETEMPNTLQNESDCEKTDQQDDGCEEESSMLSESHQRETEMPNTLQNDNQSGEIYPKNAENEKKISMPSGPGVVRVVVEEDSDVVLPCSLSSKKNIEDKLFDWRKDGQKKKEVFYYDAGDHSNNGVPGQDEQFKGRVSYFSDQLKNGNASIKIRDTKISDSGNYTCHFPRLQPRQTFYIELVVEAPQPYTRTLTATEYRALLQCEVKGASPKPKVEWKDRAGNILPAEEPQVSDRGGRYYVTLLTTVTKTDHYRCVVTQEEIHHQTHSETYVFINEKLCEELSSKELIVLLVGWMVLLVLTVATLVCIIKRRHIKELHQRETDRPLQNGFPL